MIQPILGADTETHMGYGRLLCVEDNEPYYTQEIGEWEEWTNYLLNGPKRLCFYNLRFDVEAILKHFPEPIIKNLLYLCNTEIEYEDSVLVFRLIPWKVFSIKEMTYEATRRRTKRSIEIFDTAQFYHAKLADAAHDVLGEEKIEDSDFAEELNTSERPWREEYPRILKYCQSDATLAGKLMRVFQQASASDPINLNPRNPISCAWYAKELIKQCIPEVKSIKSMQTNHGYYYSRPWKRWDNVGSQCYIGGRFEVFWKGTFENVFIDDINSAYPLWISQLPNPYNLIFVKDFEPEGDFSMVKAEVFVPKELKIGPLPFRTKDAIIFPTGQWTAWFHWHELKNAEKFGVEYNIQKALNGYEPNGIQRPFSERIPLYYDKRLIWKDQKDPRQLSSKISMNSVYGVFYEKNERIIETDQRHATEIDGHLLKKSKDNPGRYFYPFLAGWITSKTRVQLLNATSTVPEEDILFMATDGIASLKPLNVPKSKRLGEWDEKNPKEVRVFGNGLYEVDGELKTRGFRKGKGQDKRPLKERMMLEDGEIFIETVQQSPLHINKAFRLRDRSLKDALVWIDDPRKMNLTKDHKRDWPQFGIDDLFQSRIPSTTKSVQQTLNYNPGLAWKGDEDRALPNLANRFQMGKLQPHHLTTL